MANQYQLMHWQNNKWISRQEEMKQINCISTKKRLAEDKKSNLELYHFLSSGQERILSLIWCVVRNCKKGNVFLQMNIWLYSCIFKTFTTRENDFRAEYLDCSISMNNWWLKESLTVNWLHSTGYFTVLHN